MKVKTVCSMALVCIFVLTAMIPGMGVEANRSIMDRPLLEKLESEDNIELLVRFADPVDSTYIHRLGTSGLETRYTFDFVNTVYASGTPSAILRASTIPGILSMSYNIPIEHHMDITTSVINATVVWQTMINTSAGLQKGIDGAGVTVVVLDTGIDAGHTDLDYGTKTILNLKSNYDMVWTETENSDTSSGHGTHCAGTVAGNGEGSGGSRKGVAPGANLIGLGTGDYFIANALGGLEWVYENSRPGLNPYNIRVVTNSWGSSADYNRESPINDAIRRITYENNVVVTFSAGNAGSDNHDGSEVTTNPYSQEPAAVNVAAATHDGTGMAWFSSRGHRDYDFSWPDINAPGVAIWSARARRTMISGITADQGDAHYMAISGTSMSNPHVAGLVALLWEAAPLMRVSNVSGDNWDADESYFADPYTNIHEAELILKLTANYVAPAADNGIPSENWTGLLGKPKDFAQGYGLVDAHKAVGLALVLQDLREKDSDATVFDAYELFSNKDVQDNFTTTTTRYANTNSLQTSWKGEWTQVTNFAGVLVSDTSRRIHVPPEATKIFAEIEYYNMKLDQGVTMGQLTLKNDQGWSTTSEGEMDVSSSGWWTFEVEGSGFQVAPGRTGADPTEKYKEARIDYTVKLRMILAEGDGTFFMNITDTSAIVSQWDFAPPYGDTNMTIGLETYIYNMEGLYISPLPEAPPVEPRPFPWWILVLVLLALAVLAGMQIGKKGGEKEGEKNLVAIPFRKTTDMEEVPPQTTIPVVDPPENAGGK